MDNLSMRDKNSQWESQSVVENLSIHGFPKICLTQSKIGKIWWGVVTAAASVILIYMGLEIWRQYWDEKTVTSITYEEEDLRFPALYICNKVTLHPKKLVDAGNPADNLTRHLLKYIDGDSNPEGSSDQIRLLPNWMFTTFTDEYAANFSIDYHDYFLSCSYEMEYIDCKYIVETVPYPGNGNCQKVTFPDTEILFDGVMGAVDLLFYFDPKFEMGSLTPSFGALLTIGDRLPYVEEGIPINPGQLLILSVSKIRYKQEVSTKHLKCLDTESLSSKVSKYLDEINYSAYQCINACYLQMLAKFCGCNPIPGFPKEAGEEDCSDRPGVRECAVQTLPTTLGTFSGPDVAERGEFYHKFGECSANCRQLCEYEDWAIDSKKEWKFPTGKFLRSTLELAQEYEKKHNLTATKLAHELSELLQNNLTTADELARDTAGLKVFLTSRKPTTVFTVVKLYSDASLLANIGGFMGLCLGASIISLAEIAHAAFELVYLTSKRYQKDKVFQNN